MRLSWVSAMPLALLALSACYSVTPTPEATGFGTPTLVMRHGGQVVAQSADHHLVESGHQCPAGHWLPRSKVVVTGGFPASFDLEVQGDETMVAAEISVAGGTMTGLAPGAVRSTSVRDGQTVEIARQAVSSSNLGGEHLRFSVIPLTGTRASGPETVQIYARVEYENGSADVLNVITAGSESRLCGPY
ncbi:MAG: hypothetical protein AAF830_12725 [Pseudomonadota bacterium]